MFARARGRATMAASHKLEGRYGSEQGLRRAGARGDSRRSPRILEGNRRLPQTGCPDRPTVGKTGRPADPPPSSHQAATAARLAIAKGTAKVAGHEQDEGIRLLRRGIDLLRPSGEASFFLGGEMLANALVKKGETSEAIRVLKEGAREKERAYPFRARLDCSGSVPAHGSRSSIGEHGVSRKRLLSKPNS